MVKKFPKIIIVLFIVIIAIFSVLFKFNFGLSLKGSNAAAANKSVTKNTKHFSIEYKEEDVSANEIINTLEKDYEQISADLKSPDFDKIKVKIYTDREMFDKDLEPIVHQYHQVSNVIPVAGDKIYIREPMSKDPSELKTTKNRILTTLTLYAINLINPYPRYKSNWLTQGLPVFELQKQTGARYYPHYSNNAFPSIADLNLNAKTSTQVSYTLIQYISDKWGMPAITDLLKNNCDINKTLGISEDVLENQWHQYLEKIN